MMHVMNYLQKVFLFFFFFVIQIQSYWHNALPSSNNNSSIAEVKMPVNKSFFLFSFKISLFFSLHLLISVLILVSAIGKKKKKRKCKSLYVSICRYTVCRYFWTCISLAMLSFVLVNVVVGWISFLHFVIQKIPFSFFFCYRIRTSKFTSDL